MEIIGVENWGKPPFPQKGDLAKGHGRNQMQHIVKILLSHDPSHWDLKVRDKEKIELTLSGHTHGMQFGIEIGNFRWSPSRWTYKNWAGLYRENGQYLYVNRGLGFTGFPGRVGIRPEITLLPWKITRFLKGPVALRGPDGPVGFYIQKYQHHFGLMGQYSLLH